MNKLPFTFREHPIWYMQLWCMYKSWDVLARIFGDTPLGNAMLWMGEEKE